MLLKYESQPVNLLYIRMYIPLSFSRSRVDVCVNDGQTYVEKQ